MIFSHIRVYFLSTQLCLAEAQKGSIRHYNHSNTNIQWKSKPFLGSSILVNMIRSRNSSSYNILYLSITHLTHFVANKCRDKNWGSRLESILVYFVKHLPFTLKFGISFWLMLTAVWSVDLDVSFCIEIKFARLFSFSFKDMNFHTGRWRRELRTQRDAPYR